jgi:hypothetical protein
MQRVRRIFSWIMKTGKSAAVDAGRLRHVNSRTAAVSHDFCSSYIVTMSKADLKRKDGFVWESKISVSVRLILSVSIFGQRTSHGA